MLPGAADASTAMLSGDAGTGEPAPPAISCGCSSCGLATSAAYEPAPRRLPPVPPLAAGKGCCMALMRLSLECRTCLTIRALPKGYEKSGLTLLPLPLRLASLAATAAGRLLMPATLLAPAASAAAAALPPCEDPSLEAGLLPRLLLGLGRCTTAAAALLLCASTLRDVSCCCRCSRSAVAAREAREGTLRGAGGCRIADSGTLGLSARSSERWPFARATSYGRLPACMAIGKKSGASKMDPAGMQHAMRTCHENMPARNATPYSPRLASVVL